MKDPIGLLLALIFVGNGVYFYIQCEHLVKPDSNNRESKVKKLKYIGLTLFVCGFALMMLLLS